MYDVDSITLEIKNNGYVVEFWGRAEKDGFTEKFSMIYHDLNEAIDSIYKISRDTEKSC